MVWQSHNRSKALLVGQPLYFDVTTTFSYPYVSFASMAINTNDCFVALNGVYLSPGQSIEVPGYDAGTEVNDPMGGAAFSTEGGESADEGGRIRRSRGLDNFVGTGLPTGNNLAQAFDRRTPIARIAVDLAGNEPN